MNKLFWLDLEMTGLDVNKEVIIEAAALITDFNFTVLDQYETVVNQPQTYIDNMDQWNRQHHGDSGLTARVPYGKTPDQVEEDLLNLIATHWPKIEKKEDKPILAGNSIHQDRLFIDKYWPKLSQTFHYRMLDVSSWKIIFNNKLNRKYEKKNAHRALGDVQESINELKYYLQFFKA